MDKGRIQRKLLSYMLVIVMVLSVIAPTDMVNAARITGIQKVSREKDNTIKETKEDIPESQEMTKSELEYYQNYDSMLTDDVTVYDSVTSSKNEITAASEEVQTVNNVVVFIRFADEAANIYEKRGGYNYIKEQFVGKNNSLAAYVDEVSWGQVNADTYFYPQDSSGNPICYVDNQPASYYKKKSSSNTNGYSGSSELSKRREELLSKVKEFIGSDFEKKLGIEGSLYNLIFFVPDEGDWNDLLWSHKSTTVVNGVTRTYNMITYPSQSDQTRTISHEFMHSLGFPDMYHYTYNGDTPLGIWSIMEHGTGHPTVYEKQKYGKWIQNENAIQEIKKTGQYSLGVSTASQDNTLAYKIKVPDSTREYFMIEYRGGDKNSVDASLGAEGLIFYRVDTGYTGNASGPPDEVYILRNEGTNVDNAYFDGTSGKKEFSNFKLYNSEEELPIKIYNIQKKNGKMYFNIDLDTVELNITPSIASGQATETQNVTFTVTASNSANLQYQFLVDGVVKRDFSTSSSFTWKSEYSNEIHKIQVKAKNTKLNKVVATKTINYDVKDALGVSITPSIASGKATETQNITFTATAKDTKNLQFQFLVNGTVMKEYSTVPYFVWNSQHSYAGNNIVVNAKNTVTGKIITKELRYIVNKKPSYGGATIGTASPKVGQTLTIIVSGMNGTGTLTKRIEVQPEGGTKTKIFEGPISSKSTWTPTSAGKYAIHFTLIDENGISASYTMNCVVSEPENCINVYYANSSWSQAYIHYRVGNGSWTSVPGVKMNTSSEQSGYTWKYTINLGSESNATVCFNNGSNSWDSKNGANYTLKAGNFGIKNQNVEELSKEVVKEFSVSSFTTSSSVGGTNVQMYLDTEVVNGTAPYTYQYSYVLNGASTSLANSSTKKISWTPYKAGTYTLKVKVTDAQGKTAEKQISNYVVEGPKVSSFTASLSSPQKVGTKITLEGIVKNVQEDNYNSYTYSVTKDGKTTQLATSNRKAVWTPTEAGVYTLNFKFTDYLGSTVLNKTMSYTINDTSSSSVTVYYANSSWSQAYIHYRVGNGSWTNAPGVKMSTSSEQSGYTWKYTIDLGSASNATVCFNNGSNSWDSKNGANYTLKAGTFGIKNQNVEELSKEVVKEFSVSSFTTSSSVGGTNVQMYLDTEVVNGTAPYTYQYSYVLNGASTSLANSSTKKISWTPYKAGTYTLKVKVTDAQGKTAEKQISNYVVEGPKVSSFTASLSSPQKIGTKITLEGIVKNVQEDNYNSYAYSVTKDGKTTQLATSNRKAVWTPTEAGVYTLNFKFTDYLGSTVLNKTMSYTINDTSSSIVTVYYANSSWSQAYIHYRVGNGSWTNAPGVKMSTSSEQSGYTWKYTIDLGSASNATVCFNNGNNSWDSKNGANYTVYAGNYGVKNSQVTKLSGTSSTTTPTTPPTTPPSTTPPSPTPTPELKITLEADKTSPIKVGTTVKFIGNSTNENYHRYNSHVFSVAKQGGSSNTDSSRIPGTVESGKGYSYTWTPTEAGTYTIAYETIEYSGRTAKKTMTFVVTATQANVVNVYYYNSSWSQAYIHYRVGNGSWTSVPGVKMSTSSEQSGYTWKYTIDLGSASNATVCFNNGNNSWDSRNGENYTVYAGNYGVKNQQAVKLSSAVNNAPENNTSTTSLDSTVSDMTVVKSIRTVYQLLANLNKMNVSEN